MVRQLRRIACDHDPSAPKTLGGVADLTSARRALEIYATWDDSALERLIAVPNGQLVAGLAEACDIFSNRLEGRSTAPMRMTRSTRSNPSR